MEKNRKSKYDFIAHHGIKGQKWGVRRYQNTDGTLTALGKKHKKETDIAERVNAGREYLSSKGIVRENRFRELKSKESYSDSAKNTNPKNYINNCYNCVVAYIGRRCGLDVTAKNDSRNGKGLPFEDVCKAFGAEKEIVSIYSPTVERLENNIKRRYKDGDCGAVSITFNKKYMAIAGIAENLTHVINFSVENGEIIFADGQNGKDNNYMRSVMKKYMDSGKEANICKLVNIYDGLSEEQQASMKYFVDE